MVFIQVIICLLDLLLQMQHVIAIAPSIQSPINIYYKYCMYMGWLKSPIHL
ncbi:MAG: hypothetical protein OFPI_20090 [Osedax symbiont Rs2]|nr:MAG: hypothetical protein OFPI_20090 [Osedax symbiont Rs2]